MNDELKRAMEDLAYDLYHDVRKDLYPEEYDIDWVEEEIKKEESPSLLRRIIHWWRK